MADESNLSVEDVLAACRTVDGAGVAAPEQAAPEKAAAAPKTAAKKTGTEPSPPAAAAAPTKSSAEMSVADMIAAAKAEKKPAAAAKQAPPEARKPTPAAAAKKPGEMSMAEILAAARGEKSAAATPAKKPQKPAAAPASKATPKSTKTSPKAAAGAPPGSPKETSSILAAARKSPKPGPMSKAEAAAQDKSVGEKKASVRRVVPPLPEKPAYARPKPVPSGEDGSRRSFFAMLFGSFLAIGFVSLGVVSTLWGLGLARFMFPNILTEPPSRFRIGFPDDFPAGNVSTKFKAQFGVWVVNTEYEGQPMITALKTVCTHLGCTPNWLEGEQKFKCPCHGSGFYKDGVNFEGPAPRPLERYAIRVADDGQLEIDKSKTFQQELGQWNDAASFVTV